jgi:hypothetical protein
MCFTADFGSALVTLLRVGLYGLFLLCRSTIADSEWTDFESSISYIAQHEPVTDRDISSLLRNIATDKPKTFKSLRDGAASDDG